MQKTLGIVIDTHSLHRYGFTKEAVVKTIENSVRDGSVIRVKYKDSISYRNPAKITRGSGTFNPIAPKDSWSEMKPSTVKSVTSGGQQASAVASVVRKPSVGPPIDAAKRVLRVIRQIMLARQSDHGDGCTNGTSTPHDGSSEQASKGASTTVLGASIQDILTTLEHQKQQGFTADFVKPLLTRAVAHGKCIKCIKMVLVPLTSLSLFFCFLSPFSLLLPFSLPLFCFLLPRFSLPLAFPLHSPIFCNVRIWFIPATSDSFGA